jgi:hypothetical protein
MSPASIDGLNFTPGPAPSSDIAPVLMSTGHDARVFGMLRGRTAIV